MTSNNLTNFIIHEKYLHVKYSYLIVLGFYPRTLNNYISNSKPTYQLSNINDDKWLILKTIPKKKRIELGIDFSSDEIIPLIKSQSELQKDKEKHLRINEIHFILYNAWTNESYWLEYKIYYKDYLFDSDIHNLYAKTHSLFMEIFSLVKHFRIKEILEVYQRFDNATFKTDKYVSFYRKINQAKSQGISEALIHDFKRFGREPYKLNKLIRNRIKYYYSLPIKNSITQVTRLVNEELINRNIKTISYSLVRRYIKTPEVQNICNPSREGESFAKKNIYPPITRKNLTRYVGEVLEIDATPINFIVTNGESNEEFKIWICAVIEVYSRKIIGYSFCRSENSIMTIECLKMALQELKVIPAQIVHDGHTAYRSDEYKLIKHKLSEFGIGHRLCVKENPQDKGHIESWFKTLKGSYLNNEVGYLGYTIQTKGQKGRVNKELEALYKTEPFKKTEKQIIKLIKSCIKCYNNNTEKKKKSPNSIFEINFPKDRNYFQNSNISYLFHKETYTTVRQSKIRITVNQKPNSYTLQNRFLINKLNNQKVRVRYDHNNLESINVFNLNTDKFITAINRDKAINLLADKEDVVTINKNYEKLKSRIFKNIDDLRSDIDDGWEELNSHPIINIDFDEKKAKEKQEINMLLLNKTYPSNLPRRVRNRNEKRDQRAVSFYKEV
jgi:transposase InsO family protein